MPAQTYHLFWNAQTREPTGGVGVTIDVPAGWTAQVDATGAPKFSVPDLGTFSRPGIVAVAAPGATDRERLDWALAQQFGDDLGAARRTDKPGGRIWVVHQRSSGHVHARMFLAAPAPGVVMATVLLGPTEAARLPEIERAFDSVRLENR